jgi:hypothetical protein
MNLKNKTLISIFILFFSFFAFSAFAGSSHNVWGFAWSENIGWIKFNNCTDPTNSATCGPINYGVHICTGDSDPLCSSVASPKKGKLIGYAWSENIGWIRFDPSGPYPASPNFSVRVDVDGTICGQRGRICGWARAVRAINPEGQTLGGWDGWIKFSGSNYNVWLDNSVSPRELRGYAFGGDDNNSEAVIGWVSFNCKEGGSLGNNICSTSNYKVMTSFSLNQPPTAQICCQNCAAENCTAYQGSTFTLINNSTDPDNDIQNSTWDILGWGSNNDLTCSGVCNYTIPFLSSGNYTVLLSVTDSAGNVATTTKSFQVRQDIYANFQCSLDNINWTDCTGLRIRVGQSLYLRDTSTPSEGATIVSRLWTLQDGNPATSTLQNLSVSFSTTGDKTISLSVTDSAARTGTIQKIIKVQRLPIWFPVPPRY